MTLYICGCDDNFQLGEEPNNKTPDGYKTISPPIKSQFKAVSTILSYSIYEDHSVIITSDGLIQAIGDNRDGRICGLL